MYAKEIEQAKGRGEGEEGIVTAVNMHDTDASMPEAARTRVVEGEGKGKGAANTMPEEDADAAIETARTRVVEGRGAANTIMPEEDADAAIETARTRVVEDSAATSSMHAANEDEARQMRIVAACTRMVVVEFEGPIALDAAFVVLRESTSVYEFCFHLAVIDANKMLDDDDKKFERMFKQLSQLFRGHLDAHDAIKRLDAFQEEMNNV